MSSTQPLDITHLLIAWRAGDPQALEQLVPLVQAELDRLASSHMARERQSHLLQTTALVNEAWLRLIKWQNVSWQSRAHFFGVAAQLMRHILVAEARQRLAKKSGGNALRVSLAEAEGLAQMDSTELIALDDALQALARHDQRKCRIVELRFFGGLSVEEIAAVLQVSARTVMRDWSLARAWLYRELGGKATPVTTVDVV